MANNQNGFIKVHRKMLDWEWYDDIPTCRVFLHLLLTANFEDTRYKGKLIKRGQVMTGRKKLAKETGLSERQIRTALDHLKTTNELTIETTNDGSIITIYNYETYQQNKKAIDQPTDQPNANDGPHNKNIKNIKKNIYIEFLAKFNSITGKKCRTLNVKAERQLKHLLRDYSIEEIYSAVQNCAADKYHIESGLKYLTPEFITRPDKFDRFFNLKPKGNERTERERIEGFGVST